MMIKFVAFLDPRLDKYRSFPVAPSSSSSTPKDISRQTIDSNIDMARSDTSVKIGSGLELEEPEESETPEEPYTPSTTRELAELLARTPESVLTRRQRNTIAGLMTFDDVSVTSVMTPREEMTFLKDSDFLGPLVIDQLYKTGQTYFPVEDKKGNICGVIRTNQLDPLKISEDEPITKFTTQKLCYVRKDYSLEMALAAMIRTGSDYALIIDRNAELVGSLTLDVIMIMLFARRIADRFDSDSDPSAVAERAEK